MRKVLVVFAFALLVTAGLAVAQETTGALRGQVLSQDGATLPGVTVSVENENTGLRRTEVTGTSGEYRFPALPPGTYQLTATLDGFQTYRESVAVGLGATVTNNFEMALGAVTDVIEVTGEAPLVDVTSTVTGITVNVDDLNARIPVAREATQIALLAPASIQGDTAFNSDYTPGQDLASIGGSSVAENSYQVNGLNITNFRNMLGSTYVPFEFVEEVQVKTGGYEAEFGRATGGVINMVTKSGTNSLRGDVNAYYYPEDLQETMPDAYNRINTVEDFESLEGNASIGGAFVQDKLFFFGFVRYDDTEYTHEVGNADTGTDIGRYTVFMNESPYYGGKLDWNITPSHRLEGTYIVDDTDLETELYDYDVAARQISTFGGTGEQSRGGENYIGKYTGILSENFLISAQYGVNNFDRTDSSSADDLPYTFDCTVSCSPIGGWVNWQRVAAEDEREAYRLDADFYIGNHSLRGGIDAEDNVSSEEGEYSGGVRWIYYMAGDVSRFAYLGEDQMIVQERRRSTGGEFDVESNAVYLQDSWAVTPNITVNLGVRWEQYENFNALGQSFIKIDDQYAPRVGFIWDPSGEGRSKVFGSFGQYHLPIASNTNIRLAGLEYDQNWWYTVDGWDPATGNPIGLGSELETTLVSSGETPDPDAVRATNLDPMSQFEYILGYERMVGANWSLGARAVSREFNEVIEDMTIDQALSEVYGVEEGAFAYYLANPGSDFEGFYDLDGDGVLDPIAFTAGQLGYPEAERKYYALELTAQRRFADNWLMQASYTWSHSYGNYEGYVKSDIGQDDAGLTQDFDFPGLMDNAYGNLPNDRRHNLKVFGAYAWDNGLQLGGFAYYRSGRPMNSIWFHPTDPWAVLYDEASFFTADGEPAPRGSFGETDDVYGLDGMIKYDFEVADIDMNVRLDVFNIFDFDAEAEVREIADEGWLEPTTYQNPRRVRIGFGVSF